MKVFIVTLLLVCSAASGEQVYEQKNDQGTVIYSDAPLNDSKPVNLNETTNTISVPPPQTEMGVIKKDNESINSIYKTFLIISPKDQETTQGQSDIPVKLKLEPELRAGDKIQLMIDGAPYGAPTTVLNPFLHNVDRGSHQLSAVILDANRSIVKQSNLLTIYIHHTSNQLAPAFKTPPPPPPKTQ